MILKTLKGIKPGKKEERSGMFLVEESAGRDHEQGNSTERVVW